MNCSMVRLDSPFHSLHSSGADDRESHCCTAIRFVKYSADESNWLRRVGEKRDTELNWLLKTRINNLVRLLHNSVLLKKDEY